MNHYAIVILVAIVFEFLISLAGNLLNLKAVKLETPSALEGIYNREEYRKSQQYIRVTTHFSLISDSFALCILLAFWLSGGFKWFDQIIRSWHYIPLLSGLLYIGLLFFAYSLLTLPFDIYDTFVIEGRFGFNKTTPDTFFLDQVKGLGLTIAIGAPLLAGVLALFQYTGTYAWLYCWIIITAFSLTLQYVAPTWILPLFNKFKPLGAGDLRVAIMTYANSVNFPVKNIFVMDGSKRSSKSNAFFTGFGHNKRIAIFDTLIAQNTTPEIVAVLAHEIGHHKRKHILQGSIINILHTGVLLFLLSIFLHSTGLYQAFYIGQESIYTGLLFFGLLYTPIELVLTVIMHIFSRKNEYEADRFAAETIDNPCSLIDALKKLSSANLSNLTPHPFYVFLNYSHPPLLQRLMAIRNINLKSKKLQI